jgi:flagellar basal-body rod modification protein FlgD
MTSVPSADTSSSNTASTAGTQQAANSFSPDLNLFLKLLTTQLQNQDPLNPMDTSEYTQQLVQYSQVEQEMQQTSTLNDILSNLASQGVSQASSFIGREARFDTDTAGLKGDQPATWTYALASKPTALTATIKNADGKVVKEIKLDPATEGRFSWDGKLDDGTTAPDGAYTLSLSATTDSGADIKSTINAVGIVKDVVTDGQNVLLGVNGLRYSVQGLVAVSSAPTADA